MNAPTFLSPWIAPLGWLALEAAVVVLAALAVQPSLRAAATRRSLWRAVLVALALLLAAEFTGATSQLSAQLRTAWQTTFPKPAPPELPAPTPEPTVSFPISHLPSPIPSFEFVPEPLTPSHPLTLPPSQPSITPPLPPPVPVWPAAVWLTGLAALLARSAWTHAGFAWLRLRHFLPAAEALRQRVQVLAARLGLRRRVRVLASERLRAPAAFGWVRPGVGVPGDFTARFAPAQQDVMLAHELAHLAARDPLWQLLADLAAAALWWHPLAWVARRQHRIAGELAADDASQALPDGPVVLAECLLALGHEAAAAPRAALGMAGFRSQLGRRIERLVALPPRDWQAPSRARLALQTAVALLALAALALLPGCAANRTAGEAPSGIVAKWWQAKKAPTPVGDDVRSLQSNAERGTRNAESSQSLATSASTNALDISVGRQLFVDDLLVESNSLTRTWHQPVVVGSPQLTVKSTGPLRGEFPFPASVSYDTAIQEFRLRFAFRTNSAEYRSPSSTNWPTSNSAFTITQATALTERPKWASTDYESHRVSLHRVYARADDPASSGLYLALGWRGIPSSVSPERVFIRSPRPADGSLWSDLHPLTNGFLVVGRNLHFYFGGRVQRAGETHASAAVGLATLRRDGFASLDAGPEGGVVTTKPLTFTGKFMFVNFKTNAPDGEMRIEILDTDGNALERFSRAKSIALAADQTLMGVSWQNGAQDLSALIGKPVRFRFHLKNASLYSFWVGPGQLGRSMGRVAGGGPHFTSDVDTIGNASYRTFPIVRTNAAIHHQPTVQRLARIRIPELTYDGLPLPEVLKMLEQDTKRNDPDKQGVSFGMRALHGVTVFESTDPRREISVPFRTLDVTQAQSAGSGTVGVSFSADVPLPSSRVRVLTLDMDRVLIHVTTVLRDVSVLDALDAIVKTSEAAIGYTVETNRVVIHPRLPGREFVSPRVGTNAPGAALRAKAEKLVLPVAQFDGLPLPEVIKLLLTDTRKFDPEKKGVNFLATSGFPDLPAAARPAQPPILDSKGNPIADVAARRPDMDIVLIRVSKLLTNATLLQVLDAIVQHAEVPGGGAITYRFEDYGVLFTPDYSRKVLPQPPAPAPPVPAKPVPTDPAKAREHCDRLETLVKGVRANPATTAQDYANVAGLIEQALTEYAAVLPPTASELARLKKLLEETKSLAPKPKAEAAPSPFAERGEKVAEGRLRGAATNAVAANPSPQPSPLAPQREREPAAAGGARLSQRAADATTADGALGQTRPTNAAPEGQDAQSQAKALVPTNLKLTMSDTANPGDSLKITVAEDDSFDAIYIVKRDGNIMLPRVGKVAVGGKHVNEAQDAVKALLEATQLRKATVTLTFVGERVSASGASGSTNDQRVIYLAGEFITPGPLKIPEGVQPTLITSIVRSGGLTPNGDLTRVKLLRINNGQSAVEEVNVAAILSGTAPPADKPLLPGDIILVPAFAPAVHVTGSVGKPGPVSLAKDEKLTAYAAILRAGGFAPGASLTNCYIVRNAGNGEKAQLPFNVKEIQKDAAKDVILQSGDIVVVPGASPEKAPQKPGASAPAPSPFAERGEKVAEGRLRGAATNAVAANPSPQPSPLAPQRARESERAAAPAPVGDDVRRLTTNSEFGIRNSELPQRLVTSSPTAEQAAQEEAARRQERKVALEKLLGEAGQFQKIKSWTNAVVRYEEAVGLARELSVAPGLSRVSGDREEEKPLQRLSPSAPADTGLKPGANERPAFAGESAIALAGLIHCRLQLAIALQERHEFKAAAAEVDKIFPFDAKNAQGEQFKRFNERVEAAHKGRIPVQPLSITERTAVVQLVRDGQLYWQMGDYREAKVKLEEAVKKDPLNEAAFFYLRLVMESEFDVERKKREKTYGDRVVEVTKKWNEAARTQNGLPVPNPYFRTNSQVPFLTHSSKGAQRINRKLDEIVLPEVHFDGVPLVGVVQRLMEDAKKFDPEKQGLNFLINDVAPAAPLLDAAGNPVPVARPVLLSEGLIRISTPLRNLTLRQALDVICKTAELPTQFSVEEYAIVFIPRGPVAYFSRMFRVNPDTFMQGLRGVVANPVLGVGAGQASPAAGAGATTGPVRATVPATVPATPPTTAEANALVRQFFQSAGVTSLGATNSSTQVVFNPENGLLLVRGTTNDLRVIEQAIQKVQPPSLTPTNATPPSPRTSAATNAPLTADSPDGAAPPVRNRNPGMQVFLPHVPNKGSQRINAKLDEIILPVIHFDSVTLPKVVMWLDGAAKKLDPDKKGLNFMINNVVSDYISLNDAKAGKPAAPVLDAKGNPIAPPAAKALMPDLDNALIKVTKPLNDLTLRQVLDVICKTAEVKMTDGRTAGLKFTIEEYAIVFSPKLPEQASLFARSFKVDPETFIRGLVSVVADPSEAVKPSAIRVEIDRLLRAKAWTNAPASTGQFSIAGVPVINPGKAGVSGVMSTNMTAEINNLVRDYFRAAGVTALGVTNGPDATQVFFNDRTGLLLVRASLEDLDIIQMAIELLNNKPPQVLIEAKFVEMNQNDGKALGFDWFMGETRFDKASPTNRPSTVNPTGVFPMPASPITVPAATGSETNKLVRTNAPRGGTITGILAAPQFAAVIRALEQRDAASVRSLPKVTTPSGKQVALELPAAAKAEGGFAQGLKLEVLTTVAADGYTISFTVIVTRDGKQVLESRGMVWDAQTLMLGGLELPGAAAKPGVKPPRFVLFLTPTLVDAAGNRIHAPTDEPLGVFAVPAQPKPSAPENK